MTENNSPLKKRKREEDPEEDAEPAVKRQKIDTGAEQKNPKAKPSGKVVNDSSDDEAFPSDQDGSDSFDDDFDDFDGGEHAADENFDAEAYRKWCQEHPDEEPEGDDDFGEEGEFDEEGELEQSSEEQD